jgi:hypothetical protein
MKHGKSVTSDKDRSRSYRQIVGIHSINETELVQPGPPEPAISEEAEQFTEFMRQYK